MQYLLKITLKDTPVWRLVAIDGTADIAFVAELIAASFDYEKARRLFVVNGVEYSAGNGGNVENVKELSLFDELHLEQGQNCIYRHNLNNELIHNVEVMKKEDHQTVLAVSHGASCRGFMRYWSKNSQVDQTTRIRNCCILKFEFENDEFSLVEIINHDF